MSKMNRRKYHKIQTQFEKKIKYKERLIDKIVSDVHKTRKEAKETAEWFLHLKGVYILSYCQYKKKYPNNWKKSLRETIAKLSEVKKEK